jgi:hypothetical protein
VRAAIRGGRPDRFAEDLHHLYGDWDRMDEQIDWSVKAIRRLCITSTRRATAAATVDLEGLGPRTPSDRRGDFAHQARVSLKTVEHIEDVPDPARHQGHQLAEDARRAVDAGVDVVYVSNHGGCQLDHARAASTPRWSKPSATGSRHRGRWLHARHERVEGALPGTAVCRLLKPRDYAGGEAGVRECSSSWHDPDEPSADGGRERGRPRTVARRSGPPLPDPHVCRHCTAEQGH